MKTEFEICLKIANRYGVCDRIFGICVQFDRKDVTLLSTVGSLCNLFEGKVILGGRTSSETVLGNFFQFLVQNEKWESIMGGIIIGNSLYYSRANGVVPQNTNARACTL